MTVSTHLLSPQTTTTTGDCGSQRRDLAPETVQHANVGLPYHIVYITSVTTHPNCVHLLTLLCPAVHSLPLTVELQYESRKVVDNQRILRLMSEPAIQLQSETRQGNLRVRINQVSKNHQSQVRCTSPQGCTAPPHLTRFPAVPSLRRSSACTLQWPQRH